MKRMLILTAGALSLMAGTAQAGGCDYAKHQAKMAAADELVVEPAISEVQNEANLLALLKQKEDALVKDVPIIHN